MPKYSSFLRQYNLVSAFLTIQLMFLFQHSLLSNMTPKYLCILTVNHFPFYSNRFWVPSGLLKINTHLFCFWNVEIQISIITPFGKTVYLLNVHRAIIIVYLSGDFWVICQCNYWAWTMRCLQSAVYNVKRNGGSIGPCGAPVLVHTTANLVPLKIKINKNVLRSICQIVKNPVNNRGRKIHF